MTHSPNTTERLRQLVENDYFLVLDKGPRDQRHDQARVWIMTSDNRHVEEGSPPYEMRAELIPAMLEDFLATSLVTADSPEDDDGRTIYRLTSDGKKRGLGGE